MGKRSRRLLSRDHQAEYLLTWSYDNNNAEISSGLECHFCLSKPVWNYKINEKLIQEIEVKGVFTKQ